MVSLLIAGVCLACAALVFIGQACIAKRTKVGLVTAASQLTGDERNGIETQVQNPVFVSDSLSEGLHQRGVDSAFPSADIARLAPGLWKLLTEAINVRVWRMYMKQSLHSIKILLSYMQIISQLPSVLHVQMPRQLQQILRYMGLAIVDFRSFLQLDCLGFSFYELWLAHTLAVPILLLLAVVGRYAFSHHDKVNARHEAVSATFGVLFLVYPQVRRVSANRD